MATGRRIDKGKSDANRIRFTDPLFEHLRGEAGLPSVGTDPLFEHLRGEAGLPSVGEEGDSGPRRIEPGDGEARKERGTGGGGSGAEDAEGKGKSRVAR